jgi:uncharacterized membrane protein YeaQ/YmgE (transglycosylase-associated protein family)
MGNTLPMDAVWFILIGLSAGWLAGQIMGAGDYGLIGDLVVGVVGALLGGFLFQAAGIPISGGLPGSLVVATAGSMALIAGLRVLRRVEMRADVTNSPTRRSRGRTSPPGPSRGRQGGRGSGRR